MQDMKSQVRNQVQQCEIVLGNLNGAVWQDKLTRSVVLDKDCM